MQLDFIYIFALFNNNNFTSNTYYFSHIFGFNLIYFILECIYFLFYNEFYSNLFLVLLKIRQLFLIYNNLCNPFFVNICLRFSVIGHRWSLITKFYIFIYFLRHFIQFNSTEYANCKTFSSIFFFCWKTTLDNFSSPVIVGPGYILQTNRTFWYFLFTFYKS